jgi:hypothetical protein
MFVVIATTICIFGAAAVWRAVKSRSGSEVMRPSIVLPVAFAAYFGVGGLAAYHLDSYYLLTGLTRNNYAFAAAYAFVALLCFLIGARVTEISHVSESIPYRESWPSQGAPWLAASLLVANWATRLWLASQGLVIKGTFNIFLAPSVWARIAIVAQNDLSFLLAIVLGIASTKSRLWAIVAVIAGVAEMAFFALTINRTQGLVFIALALGARLLVQPAQPWQKLRPFLASLAVIMAAVFYTGQAVRNAIYKDLQAFLDQDTARITDLVWESLLHPEIQTADENFYSNRLNPYDFLGSVVYAMDEQDQASLKGRTFATYVPLVIPRLFWRGKPDPSFDAEGSIEQDFGLPFVDTMVTPVTELYANFRLLGVVGGYVMLGLWYGFLYRRLLQRPEGYREWQVVMYLLFLVPLCWMENAISHAYFPYYRDALVSLAVLWLLVGVLRVIRPMGRSLPERAAAMIGQRWSADLPSKSRSSSVDLNPGTGDRFSGV